MIILVFFYDRRVPKTHFIILWSNFSLFDYDHEQNRYIKYFSYKTIRGSNMRVEFDKMLYEYLYYNV